MFIQPASEPCLTNGYMGNCEDCPDKAGCEPARDKENANDQVVLRKIGHGVYCSDLSCMGLSEFIIKLVL